MRKGTRHTPEALAKIKANNARKGKKFTFTAQHVENLRIANKGQVPWIKGKTQTVQHIKNRVQARIKNGTTSKVTSPRQEAHYLWKEDRTQLSKGDEHRNSPAHREWSRNVKNRDEWRCRISNHNCDGKLVAHHILSWAEFPDLRYQLNNGITLCHAHHPRRRAEEKRLVPTFQELVSVSN